MVLTAADCGRLIRTADAAAIAAQLQRDGELCDANALPSPLARHLPPPTARSRLVDEISHHLLSSKLSGVGVSKLLRNLLYESLRNKILDYLRFRGARVLQELRAGAAGEDDFDALRDWRGIFREEEEELKEKEKVRNGTIPNENKEVEALASSEDVVLEGNAKAQCDFPSPHAPAAAPERAEIPTNEEVQSALEVLRKFAKLHSEDSKRLVLSSAYGVLQEYLDAQNDNSTTTSTTTRHDINAFTPDITKLQHHMAAETTLPSTDQEPPAWKTAVGQYQSKLTERMLMSSSNQLQRCYICRFSIHAKQAHRRNAALCDACGEFNIAGSHLSTPAALKLAGRTAVVTGGRINLGYYTALRLLRCGARVIVSSRYPQDAQARYSKETDFGSWPDRLCIIGADFRCARDAFALVEDIKRQLKEWEDARLDILINNAAQTLTDSIEREKGAVAREQALQLSLVQQGGSADSSSSSSNSSNMALVSSSSGYHARIRGVSTTQLAEHDYTRLPLPPLPEDVAAPLSTSIPPKEPPSSSSCSIGEPAVQHKSSWVQSIADIPYEDVISAHAVNTFVPLILCRELLPLMGYPPAHAPTKKPSGYIVNVSSREGLFESSQEPRLKGGHHVHTNMSKAALNMITETEASVAWGTRRIAMNTVDPGYMSAAPEIEAKYGGVLPLTWEDGAARVLWPVAVGEREEKVIRGRFLKHYGEVEAHINP